MTVGSAAELLRSLSEHRPSVHLPLPASEALLSPVQSVADDIQQQKQYLDKYVGGQKAQLSWYVQNVAEQLSWAEAEHVRPLPICFTLYFA